jgi:hypothetical protein
MGIPFKGVDGKAARNKLGNYQHKPYNPEPAPRLAASTKPSCRALTNPVRLAVIKTLIIHQGFLGDQSSQLLFCG